MIGIIDYGVGNIFSLKQSIGTLKYSSKLVSEREEMLSCDKLILPGVGAFQDAANLLRKGGFDKVIYEAVDKKIPILGICLGMQLLFDESYEYGVHKGLGLIKGKVKNIREILSCDCKLPHISWNDLMLTEKGRKSKLFSNIKDGDNVYFVHSFAAVDCDESVTSYTDYNGKIVASVERDLVFGTQFHPEKSGDVGLRIIDSFCKL